MGANYPKGMPDFLGCYFEWGYGARYPGCQISCNTEQLCTLKIIGLTFPGLTIIVIGLCLHFTYNTYAVVLSLKQADVIITGSN